MGTKFLCDIVIHNNKNFQVLLSQINIEASFLYLKLQATVNILNAAGQNRSKTDHYPNPK